MNTNEPHTKTPVLTVADLGVTLSNEVIIDKLSFTIFRGEHCTIIGPNGSGKTTLFRALIGMIPYRGTLTWAPEVVIGYVPQKLDLDRNVPLSLRDFLESKQKKVTPDDLQKKLELVGLSQDFLKKPLGSLSGGEFQQALVAFALMGNTTVLLFDEPTAGIDKPNEETIYETLHRLQGEQGLTILTISHDLSLVHRYADTVLCLNRQYVCFGPPQEVLHPKTLAELYGAHDHKFVHHTHGH